MSRFRLSTGAGRSAIARHAPPVVGLGVLASVALFGLVAGGTSGNSLATATAAASPIAPRAVVAAAPRPYRPAPTPYVSPVQPQRSRPVAFIGGLPTPPAPPATPQFAAPLAPIPPMPHPPAISRPAPPLPANTLLPGATAGSIPDLPILPFQEAHWQGIEAIPLTPILARALDIPADLKGVLIDEATMPADAAGFLAGDLVTAVNMIPTRDLLSFIKASEKVRNKARVEIDIIRKGGAFSLVLTPMLFGRLGTANGETAQTIPPGSVPPHGNLGACTNCHRIGTKGQLPVDQGDLLAKTAPVITAGMTRPHRDRGTCISCHKIVAAPVKPGML